MQRLFTAAVITAIVFVGTCLAPSASAQIVPYKAKGTNARFNPATGQYGGSGVATHLGKHTFDGDVALSPTADPFVSDFVISPNNPQQTTGANGDIIYFSGSGQVQLIPLEPTFTLFSAVWSGEFVIEGGTGRFANSGPGHEPLKVSAINDPFTFADPFWFFDWTLKGTIRLK